MEKEIGTCNLCGVEDVELQDAEERGMICEDCGTPYTVPCCKCGRSTTIDDVYEDLCYRCCRADNE